MMEIDSFYVPECDDEGGERYYFRIGSCPCAEECSERSWHRVQATSFISADACKEIVKNHLTNSDKRRKTEDEADAILDMVEPDVVVESERDRKAYRDRIDGINVRKKRRVEENAEVDDDFTGARSSQGKVSGKGRSKNVSKGSQSQGDSIAEDWMLAVQQPTQPTTVPAVTSQSLGYWWTVSIARAVSSRRSRCLPKLQRRSTRERRRARLLRRRWWTNTMR
jgi:hypothetical protein